ncbi:MAG TPA: shikimate dehydrogenase [Bacteroidota bacterium]|nr:shikimate dehydrogenase [Bacteroidota bacterium]
MDSPLRFGIIGYPIVHTLSPLMHETAFRALGIDATYEAIEVHPQSLRYRLRELIEEEHYSGLNVTIPHKETVVRLLDEMTKEAAQVGAVNTITVKDGAKIGTNTDVFGLGKVLEQYKDRIAGNEVILLGTGGGARAAAVWLLNHAHPDLLRIVTRHIPRAEKFIASFKPIAGNTVLRRTATTGNIKRFVESAVLVINATPVGMSPKTDASPLDDTVRFREGQIVFDLIYRPRETTLLRRAKDDGATAVGGLEMLLWQGAQAFEMWTGKTMPVEVVRKKIEEAL